MRLNRRTTISVIITAMVCLIIPFMGFRLRSSTNVAVAETDLLRALTAWPESLRDCSALLAFMFSALGCVAILAVLAVIDFRIVRSIRTVIGDIIIAALPFAYVTGIKWLVERPRPVTAADSALLPGDPSFPSGHTAAAAIVAVMIVLTVRNAAYRKIGSMPGTAPGRADQSISTERRGSGAPSIVRTYEHRAVAAGVAIVIVVACSRLLLGLHFPTDVLTSAVVCPLISYMLWRLREDMHMTKA
ncbi:phosphatase PAP2 family protein [Bifidobacterium sp. 64T4]|uniref:phosphatase PAP2 family protein n=1 Tax=Bifidobacterium pongonis TaxID=2834432 RepID=UPI001C56EDBD|nr:phosphatase PAP2 family protein [Bifidobacterium pongonis]MBW3095166.1 phosphatase PAP2 family protein [Bifidobacterium pongonis]